MSGVSFNFPNSTQAYNLKPGLIIDGQFNNKDEQETQALDIVLISVFPKSTDSWRKSIIKDIASGIYTKQATKPNINEIMVKILRHLREEPSTDTTYTARHWFMKEILKANPGKTLEEIFNEVCAIRYSFVTGERDPYPEENPILPRISTTLYEWAYFPTLINNPVLEDLQEPRLTSIYKKVLNRQTVSIDEVKLLVRTALNERAHIYKIVNGAKKYHTRLNMIDTLLKIIQNITLLSPEQLLTY